MKIFIIGDSNTYGWDPRDFMGGQYRKPWPKFLKEAGCTVAVDAVPGCEIPHVDELISLEKKLIRKEDPDMVIILLGSNDILNMAGAEEATRRMELFLDGIGGGSLQAERLKRAEDDLTNTGSEASEFKVLIMAIPEIRIPGEYHQEAIWFNSKIKELAAARGCLFFDTPQNLPLAFDGVHLTEEGHEILGRALASFLNVS